MPTLDTANLHLAIDYLATYDDSRLSIESMRRSFRFSREKEFKVTMMTIRDPLEQIENLYHFTDHRNLASIRRYGGLLSLAKLNKCGIDIPAPGGNDWSHDADTRVGVDNYVHLCFCSNHPMECRARNDGRIQSSIFLAIDPKIINLPGVLFTSEVSNKADCTYHSMDQARDIIDFNILYTWNDWQDQAIQARRQCAEKYEILVPNEIPMHYIRNMPNG